MDFRILGPLEVSDSGRAVSLGGVKQRSLLAILLQHPNAIVSKDHLLAELWGDAPPASADNSSTSTSRGCGRSWGRIG